MLNLRLLKRSQAVVILYTHNN